MSNNNDKKRSVAQHVGLISGIVLFVFVLVFVDLQPDKPIVTKMAAVALLMAVWWFSDAIPLFATSLLPIILFPLLGIMKGAAIAPTYINSTIFLFIGGFMIALTMEKWNLHKRIALFIIRLIGGGPSRIIMGFMLAAAFLSMWISNTATAIMMLPIAMAIISKMEEKFDETECRGFSVGLMLAIAYACSLGGMATLVGTPPNLAFIRIFEITFPEAQSIAFGTWLVMGLPLSSLLLVIVWLMITKVMYRIPQHVTIDKTIVNKEYRQLGKMSFEERTVLLFFTLTAGLWVFRENLNIGVFIIPGWSNLIPYPDLIDDGTVALFMATLLFLIPSRSPNKESATIIGADVVRKMPWDIVLLFGGGFALASGFQVTGLSALIGEKFGALAGIPVIFIILAVCFGLTFMTELTSNTATTQMILPIMATIAIDLDLNPLMLMVPATLSASCAFMMPVATPPNAIVFGSGKIKISEMVRIGIFINIVGVIIITLYFYYIGTSILSIDPGSMPNWAK